MSESEDDQDEFTVEKVLRHATVGSLRKKGHLPDGHVSRGNDELLYRIRWEGYGTDEESLEPEGSLEHIDKFQEYKKSRGIVTKRIPSNDKENADTFVFISEKSPAPIMVPKVEPKKRGRKPGTPNGREGGARGGRARGGSRASSAAGSSIAGSAKGTPRKPKRVVVFSESESDGEAKPGRSSPAKAKKPVKAKKQPIKRKTSSDDSQSTTTTVNAALSPGGSLQLEDGWAKITRQPVPVVTSGHLQPQAPSKVAPRRNSTEEEEPTASTSKNEEPAARKKTAIGTTVQQRVAEMFNVSPTSPQEPAATGKEKTDAEPKNKATPPMKPADNKKAKGSRISVAELFEESPASPQEPAATGKKKAGAKPKNKATPPVKSAEGKAPPPKKPAGSKKAKESSTSNKRPHPESPIDGSNAKKLSNFTIPKKPKLDVPEGPSGSGATPGNSAFDFRSPIDNPAPKPPVLLAPPVVRPPPSTTHRDLVQIPAVEEFSSRPLADKSAEELQPKWKRFNNVPVLSPPSGQVAPSPPTSGATEAASTEPKPQEDEPPATDVSEQSLTSGSSESLPADTQPKSVDSTATALPPTILDEEPDSSDKLESLSDADAAQPDAEAVPPPQAACEAVAPTTHSNEPVSEHGAAQLSARSSSSESPVPPPCDPPRAATLTNAPEPEKIAVKPAETIAEKATQESAETATEKSAEKEQPAQGTSSAQVGNAEPPPAPEPPATFGKIAKLWNFPLQLPPAAAVPDTPPPIAQVNSALKDALSASVKPKELAANGGPTSSKPDSPSKNPFANWLKKTIAESPRAKRAIESKTRSPESSKTTTESSARATAAPPPAMNRIKKRAESMPRATLTSALPKEQLASAMQRLKEALPLLKAAKQPAVVQAPSDPRKARDETIVGTSKTRKRKADAGRSRYVPPRKLPPQRSVIVRDVVEPLQCFVIRSRRQLDWEKASAYVRRVAESGDYLEDENDEPVIFAKCSSTRCPVMENELFCKELPPDTSMPVADRCRRRHSSETIADGYVSRPDPQETLPLAPPSIKQLQEFAEDTNDGHLTSNRLKRAFASSDLVAIGRIVDECVARRIPRSHQYIADRVVGRWLTHTRDGRTTMTELFRAKAVDRSLCGVVEHDVCSFLSAVWQMFRAETQQTLLRRFDTEQEPFVLQCLSSAAPCQLAFAVRMGLPLGARSGADASPLELALQRGHSKVYWDLMRLGADCAAEVARKSQIKDHPVIVGHLRSLRRFVCVYLAHCELGLPSLVHFPVRPISDVHVCRLPPFPSSSSEFTVQRTSAEDGQNLKTVLVIFTAQFVPKENADGFKPVLRPLNTNDELKFSPYVASVPAQSEDGRTTTDLSFLAAKLRQMWLFEWPKDSPIGFDPVRLHVSLDRNARYEPDVLFLTQLWHVAHLDPQAAISF